MEISTSGKTVLIFRQSPGCLYWGVYPSALWCSLWQHVSRSWHVDEIYGEPIFHDDVMKWKHFPRYWPFVRGIHRSPVNSPHGALMFSLTCVWINGWVNNREAGDLRPIRAHYDVIVMFPWLQWLDLLMRHWDLRINNGHQGAVSISGCRLTSIGMQIIDSWDGLTAVLSL